MARISGSGLCRSRVETQGGKYQSSADVPRQIPVGRAIRASRRGSKRKTLAKQFRPQKLNVANRKPDGAGQSIETGVWRASGSFTRPRIGVDWPRAGFGKPLHASTKYEGGGREPRVRRQNHVACQSAGVRTRAGMLVHTSRNSMA
jgi:hypothetical protein